MIIKLEIKFNWIKFETTLLLTLTRAAITDITLSRRCTCKIGIVDCKIWNLQILPIALSKWIVTFEIFWELSTSFLDICDFPLLQWELFKIAPWVARIFVILKPRSANIRSPCCKTYEIQNASWLLVRNRTSPFSWKKTNDSNRCYCNQIFDGVGIFIIIPSLCTCLQI